MAQAMNPQQKALMLATEHLPHFYLLKVAESSDKLNLVEKLYGVTVSVTPTGYTDWDLALAYSLGYVQHQTESLQ